MHHSLVAGLSKHKASQLKTPAAIKPPVVRTQPCGLREIHYFENNSASIWSCQLISDTLFSCSLLSFLKASFPNPPNFSPVSPQLPSAAVCKITQFVSQLQWEITDTVQRTLSSISIPAKLKDKQAFCILIMYRAIHSKNAAETYSNSLRFDSYRSRLIILFCWGFFVGISLWHSMKNNGEHACTSEE